MVNHPGPEQVIQVALQWLSSSAAELLCDTFIPLTAYEQQLEGN